MDILFRAWNGSGNDWLETKPNLLHPVLDLPPDVTRIVIVRKFVVISQDDTVIIGIGPVYGGEAGEYLHRSIVFHFEGVSERDCYGGGYLLIDRAWKSTYDHAISGYSKTQTTRAQFERDSGDFGMYSPRILQVDFREAIRLSLGVDTVDFVWSSESLRGKYGGRH